MGNLFVITVKEPYASKIERGEKIYEVRTRVPAALVPGNILVIVAAGSFGRIIGAYEVNDICSVTPLQANKVLGPQVGVPLDELIEYAGFHEYLFAIRLGKCYKSAGNHYIQEYGMRRPPQWFAQLSIDNETVLRKNFGITGLRTLYAG